MGKKVKLTKEMILTALKKGKVSYIPISGYISPSRAKKFLLKIAEHIEDTDEIDLSIAFNRRPKASKIATHKQGLKTLSQEKQR